MSKAPYDDRNEADYREISRRITSALDEMEMDPTIPATETVLASRASCSRGTLRNRAWPRDRLKAIKQQRLQQASTAKPKRITLSHRLAVEVHIEDKRKLMEQLDKSRGEAALWCNKALNLEGEKKKLNRAVTVLGKAKEALEDRNKELERRIRDLENVGATEQDRNVVLPFPKALDGSAGKRSKGLRKSARASNPTKRKS